MYSIYVYEYFLIYMLFFLNQNECLYYIKKINVCIYCGGCLWYLVKNTEYDYNKIRWG